MPMTHAEAARRLRIHHTDVGFTDAPDWLLEALTVAISVLQAQPHDHEADSQREQLARMSRQLEALSPLMQNMADALDHIAHHPSSREPVRRAAQETRASLHDAFDSILHPSFYKRYL